MEQNGNTADQTRQAFMEAFCLLYAKDPIEKITVLEVSKKAGYNRSTFYQYFLDIYDLLDEVEDTMADYICENRESIDMYSNSFVSSLVELYDTKSVYVNALLGVYGKQHFIEKLLSKKKLNIPELNLPDDNRFKPYLIEYHISAVISIFQLWLHRGKDLSVDELIQLTADLYKGGLSEAGVES